MLPLSTLSIFCTLLLLHQASAASIEARVYAGCAVLNATMYCYGGYLGAQGGQFINAKTDHYSVDLSVSNMNVLKPTLNWTSVNTPQSNTGPSLEPRANFPITAIDQSRYVILGGATSNATLNTPAILYDSSKNAWQALANPPFYMSSGDVVTSSDGNTLWAYGGTLNSSNAMTPKNTLQLDLTSLPGTWTTRVNSVAPPANTRHGHAAVISGNQIYYFGGYFASSATQSFPVPMNAVYFYNTVSDQWGRINCEGANPSNRTYHTATLINNSSKVLIYGGTGSDTLQALPLQDYAYLWDTNNHRYVPLDKTAGDPGPRIGHSAVQYKTNILISFGYDGSGYLRSDTTVLDVSTPSYPTWMGTKSSTTSYPDPNDGSNKTGAIAGGVVGGIAGIAIIAGAFFYFHRRKKNQPIKNDFDLYQPPQGFHTDDSPTLFTSGLHHDSEAGNNSSASGTTKKNNDNANPLEMYSTEPAPNYHHIKPDEGDHRPSNDLEPLSRVKPSGND